MATITPKKNDREENRKTDDGVYMVYESRKNTFFLFWIGLGRYMYDMLKVVTAYRIRHNYDELCLSDTLSSNLSLPSHDTAMVSCSEVETIFQFKHNRSK